jgi:hypothetical protein
MFMMYLLDKVNNIRNKPRKDWFYIGSNKDKLAYLYKKLEDGKNEII